MTFATVPELRTTIPSGCNWQAGKAIKVVNRQAASERRCYTVAWKQLALYLQFLSSTVKEKWDLKTKDLLIFLHFGNLRLAWVLRLFSDFCLGIYVLQKGFRELCHSKPLPNRGISDLGNTQLTVICQVTGVWTLRQVWDVLIRWCVRMHVYSQLSCPRVLCVYIYVVACDFTL